MRPDSLWISMDVQELSAEKPYSEGWETSWKALTRKDHNWLHAEVVFYAPIDFKAEDLKVVVCMDHAGGAYGYMAKSIHPDSLKHDAWNRISFDYLTPEVRISQDKISSYAWYRGNGKVYVKDFIITQYERNR